MTGPLNITTEDQRYLEALYPDAPDDAWIVLSWGTASQLTHAWFRVAQREELLTCIRTERQRGEVYCGVGLRDPRITPHGTMRGTSDQVFALPALWVEMDHNEGVHASPYLPSPLVLQRFIDTLPFSFSLLISSGGGFHGYLLFKELWILDTPEERAKAHTLLKRFQRTLQMLAVAEGWHIDSTTDLSRILRPAGTLNHKSDPPRDVSILCEEVIRYNPSDISDAPWLAIIDEDNGHHDATHTAAQYATAPPVPVAPMVAGCAWLQHCRDDAATLSEPEWYAMLGLLGRCEGGAELAQTWSEPYPRYSARETRGKLKHALANGKARTCQNIRYDLNADAYCRACPAWSTIKSPIVLSMSPRTTDPFGTTLPPVGWPAAHSNGTPPTVAAPASPRGRPRDPASQADWYQEHIEPYVTPKTHIVKANNTTIMAFLRNHQRWQGQFWWDDMANKPMYQQTEITDHLITNIGAIFGSEHALPIANDLSLARCLVACCQDTHRDPLIEWLGTLAGWDGTPRLQTWLIDCAGVGNTKYNRFISHILPVSMIARAFDPGCIYRNVVIFEGPEEYRKSTFVASLVPKKGWHAEMTCSFDSKDAPMMIQGLWVAELSELDSLSRTEETRLKAFISATEDPYVPKFKIFRTAPKRRTIFVGTTNESSYLKSTTGNTRFLPIRIMHPIDVEEFVAMREQLFAEAMLYYGDHRASWWMMPDEVRDEAMVEREQRRQVSVYEADLAVWLEKTRFIQDTVFPAAILPVAHETSWTEIAVGFLKLDTPEKWKDINLQKQISQALKALGWQQKIVRRDGNLRRLWIYDAPLPF